MVALPACLAAAKSWTEMLWTAFLADAWPSCSSHENALVGTTMATAARAATNHFMVNLQVAGLGLNRECRSVMPDPGAWFHFQCSERASWAAFSSADTMGSGSA